MRFVIVASVFAFLSCSYAPPPTVALTELHRGTAGKPSTAFLFSARTSTGSTIDSAGYRGETGKQLTLSAIVGIMGGNWALLGGASNLNPIIAGSYFLDQYVTITPYVVPDTKNVWGGMNVDFHVSKTVTISGGVSREQFWGTTDYQEPSSNSDLDGSGNVIGAIIPEDHNLGNYWCYRMSAAFHFGWGPETHTRAFAMQPSMSLIAPEMNRKYDMQVQTGTVIPWR